jgi:hypothetical protein
VKQIIVPSVLAIFSFVSGALAQVDAPISDTQKLLGTWKLVSYVGEEELSGARSGVMGPRPSGYINYGPDGRMIVIIVGSDRRKPVGPIATQEEAQDLIRSMLAYAGTYTVDSAAKTVTHHVEISWDQSRTGASQVRTYKLDGDLLTLITQPSNDPATGKKTVRTLVWERMK